MMSGQSINDRITAARLSIAGQGLAKSVCKATTEEIIGPKKKHLDYLLHCTNEPNVSIPQMANFLIERTNNTSWVVVFKALLTVHHLMCYGNERFTQYLASSNCNFQLGSFLDKTGVQAQQSSYDMSTFIRRYAKYLNEKAMSYRTVAFDFCKVKRGKDDGILRTMNAEKLLKTIPVLQNQLDALLEFDCTANELTNGVINTCFMLLFRDLIRLFACYNDGIINLLEKYFDMNKKMCRDALDIYKKFLIRMDRVAEFLKVAENVGIDKGDIPDLTKAPSSLLDALDQHLATLEGRKGGATTPTQGTAGRQSSVQNAVLALSNTSSAFGTAAASAGAGPAGIGVNGGGGSPEVDGLKKIALEEEEAVLELHKERRLKELASRSPFAGEDGSGGGGTNPFLNSPVGGQTDNLFGSPTGLGEHGGGGGGGGGGASKASDDLLCLTNNPFTDGAGSGAPPAMGNFWMDQNGISLTTSSSSFVPETSFTAVFGANPGLQQAYGLNKPSGGAATDCESGADQEGSGVDLNIPAFNPFAANSGTPSPSVPFEFGGLGTTPILGGHDAHHDFGFADFGHAATATTLTTGAGGRVSRPESPFDGAFGGSSSAFAGVTATADSLAVEAGAAPHSPAPGSLAPKPTPATSPGPALHHLPPGASPLLGKSALGGGPPPRPSQPPSQPATALDDLNAAIQAALSRRPASPGAGGVAAASAAAPSPLSASPGLSSDFGGAFAAFGSPSKAPAASEFDAFGDILQPMSSAANANASKAAASTKGQPKVITGDLDSSLMSLVQNLDINRTAGGVPKSGNMWNSPKNSVKTGGANWTPQIASATAAPAWNSPQHGAHGYMPMGATSGRPADWSSGLMGGHFPTSGAPPAAAGVAPAAAMTAQQPGTAPGAGFPGTAPFRPPTQAPALDPFGAL